MTPKQFPFHSWQSPCRQDDTACTGSVWLDGAPSTTAWSHLPRARPGGVPCVFLQCFRLRFQVKICLVLWRCGLPSSLHSHCILDMDGRVIGIRNSLTWLWQFSLLLNLCVTLPPPWETELALGSSWLHLRLKQAWISGRWVGEAQLMVPPQSPQDIWGCEVFAVMEEHASRRWSNRRACSFSVFLFYLDERKIVLFARLKIKRSVALFSQLLFSFLPILPSAWEGRAR